MAPAPRPKTTDPLSLRASLLARSRAVVVKIGTGVLTAPGGGIDRAVLDAIAGELAALTTQTPARRVVVVSSGAIALGVQQLGLDARPKRMDMLQACAAAGQGHLIRLWSEAFAPSKRVVAQVLLTHADLADRQRFLNARAALDALASRGAVPVINENDTVSVDEIAFGDNDSLSAQVANVARADVLVMLSVAPALLDDAGERVPFVAPGNRAIDRFIRTDTSTGGKGGMVTKVRAARAAAAAGATAVIASGRLPGVLTKLFAGEDVGTVFAPAPSPRSSRSHWIAHTLRARGTLIVDDGARKALVEGRRSLLPSGVREVRGSFRRGDPVDIAGADGKAFARGLAAYASGEMEQLQGHKTKEIADVLGYHLGEEAVHRDDLVLLDG
jgi:glutamate 5-kinase